MADMQYRRVGPTGLQLSVLSFGSWVTFGSQLDVGRAVACLDAAYSGRMNFFDNAESYAGGQSETIMGRAIAQLGWPRWSYVISTKVYWGIHGGVNMTNTLNRKYLLQAIDGSLERLGLDFVDVLYCHRPDPNTPIEEMVWAMSDIVADGKATYWGTSEWSADEIRAACEIAERHHLRRPVVEQPQYHLTHRNRVEQEYKRLYEDWGLGLTTWSPLASGLWTGKYVDGVPDNSRASVPGYEWLKGMVADQSRNERAKAFAAVAADLGVTPSQLAIAWCARNERVSSVITGASRPEQVVENLGALDALAHLDRDVRRRINEAVGWIGIDS